MNQPILELKNIEKKFNGVPALSNVSLSVSPGSCHAIVGENGAGKSTLIKILTGAYSKDNGEIYFEGNKVENMEPKLSKSLGIHCIYQELTVANHLSVAENIFLGNQPRTKWGLIDWNRMYTEAADLLQLLNIKLDPKMLVKEISIAQKQMVEIARAVSQQARILIMDEPTSSLSEREIEILLQLITELKEKSVSILYISHRMEEIFRISDTITVLRDGQHVKTLKTNEIENTDRLVELMVNRKMTDYFNKIAVPIGETILEVCNLNVENVLKNINFEVRKGEILGIAGLVGSGRTEIAKSIFGLLKKDDGQIIIHGIPRKIVKPRDAIRLGIGFVTENRKETGLTLKMSVRENVTLLNLKRFEKKLLVNKKKERNVVEDYKKKLRIKTASIEQKIATLSGGNQQKTILARWISQRPQILILDEPCRGVDVGAKSEIFAEISRLAEQGVAIIMISSEIPEIEGMCDRTLVMCEGQISGTLDKENINADNILKLAFGGVVHEK
ncbi:sugar ABC transporter ATP-binding protein [Paenibacillus sabinae]|uniref:Ribose ABC transporter ATP-binding protein n=1 Tax=Paenibacillus sabinae T27 TaxID=1268072 RepID=X4ZZQ0_9BACL|nr:sugar ABC transporter ATP-binding protein [Paenibacillus sabinae]AHV97648.1 ribose ABC transporter ATP-binding protein [Paenibacillus sabinae T27]